MARCSFSICPPAPLLPSPAARLQNKRFLKRTKDNPGGIVSVESPLHYSNVKLVDPQTGQPVRVTWRFLEDGTKVRAAAQLRRGLHCDLQSGWDASEGHLLVEAGPVRHVCALM